MMLIRIIGINTKMVCILGTPHISTRNHRSCLGPLPKKNLTFHKPIYFSRKGTTSTSSDILFSLTMFNH